MHINVTDKRMCDYECESVCVASISFRHGVLFQGTLARPSSHNQFVLHRHKVVDWVSRGKTSHYKQTEQG